MEQNVFLLSSSLFLLVILYLLDSRKAGPTIPDPDSETHARARYSVAEKIKKELEA